MRIPAEGDDARSIHEIPLVELAGSARLVLRERAEGLPWDELVRLSAELLGFARVGARIQRRVEKALTQALEKGQLRAGDNDRILAP